MKLSYIFYLILFLSIILLIVNIKSYAVSININVEINNGHGLSFQLYDDLDKTLTLNVISGDLNTTTAEIGLNKDSGYFQFNPIGNCTLQLTETMDKVQANGFNSTNDLVNINLNDKMVLTEGTHFYIGFEVISFEQRLYWLGMGIFGLGLFVASPITIYELSKKKGKIFALFFGMALLIIAFGLVVTWLTTI